MSIEPSRWDDYVLGALLLVIGVPRATLAVLYDRPIGAEDTLSILLVAFGLGLVLRLFR